MYYTFVSLVYFTRFDSCVCQPGNNHAYCSQYSRNRMRSFILQLHLHSIVAFLCGVNQSKSTRWYIHHFQFDWQYFYDFFQYSYAILYVCLWAVNSEQVKPRRLVRESNKLWMFKKMCCLEVLCEIQTRRNQLCYQFSNSPLL